MSEKAFLYILDGRKGDLKSASKKKYIVQYNPEKITVSAGEPFQLAGDKIRKTGTDKNHRRADYSWEEYSIKVTIPLRLDKSDEYIQGRAMGETEEKDISVGVDVEGFIAMARNPNTSYFTFSWGSLCYSGKLVSVSGQYTMFTPEGIPIRAEVSLTMKCYDIDKGSQWADIYGASFSRGKVGISLRNNKSLLKKAVLKIQKAKYSSTKRSMTPVNNSFYTIEVQYNPASLSLSAGLSDVEGENEEGLEKRNGQPPELSFELIFDETESKDEDCNVALITNGLISLMSDKILTGIEFYWGDMVFAGHLTSVSGEFIMFSPGGNPLRSKVSISIAGSDNDTSGIDYSFDKLTEKRYGSI